MDADYRIHGGWGDHINWMVEDWAKVDLNKDLIQVHGHLPKMPVVGQTLMGEFEKSFIKFEFVEVEYMSDPPDQFFAKVKAVEQEMKTS